MNVELFQNTNSCFHYNFAFPCEKIRPKDLQRIKVANIVDVRMNARIYLGPRAIVNYCFPTQIYEKLALQSELYDLVWIKDHLRVLKAQYSFMKNAVTKLNSKVYVKQ